MFSSAVSVGMRLNDWKMKPRWVRRSLVRFRWFMRPISWPSTTARPDVTRSRPAMQCMSVDLPEPEGPMIAVKRPDAKSTSIPSRAVTAVSPEP